jgi:hypothetical protein
MYAVFAAVVVIVVVVTGVKSACIFRYMDSKCSPDVRIVGGAVTHVQAFHDGIIHPQHSRLVVVLATVLEAQITMNNKTLRMQMLMSFCDKPKH